MNEGALAQFYQAVQDAKLAPELRDKLASLMEASEKDRDIWVQRYEGAAAVQRTTCAELKRLKAAANALYDAGVWSCDNPHVDEGALWTELRDALQRTPGRSPLPWEPGILFRYYAPAFIDIDLPPDVRVGSTEELLELPRVKTWRMDDHGNPSPIFTCYAVSGDCLMAILNDGEKWYVVGRILQGREELELPNVTFNDHKAVLQRSPRGQIDAR